MTPELFVKVALQAWDLQIKRADQLFTSFTDEQMLTEVAPGRNRAIYLLGHLAATHDAMNDILGLAQRKYAHLDEAFLKNRDKADLPTPSLAELRSIWTEVNTQLSARLNALPAEEWLKRHTKMTEEDYAKEPTRNKLSVLISRTTHVAYHLGQLVFLKKA